MEIVRFLLFPLLLGRENDSWKSSQSSHLLSYVSKFTKGNDGLLLYVANDNWMPSGIPANVTWLSWELSLPSVGIRVCVSVCVWERKREIGERERVGEEVCTYRAAHWFARTVRSLARILATSPEHVASGNGGWRRWKWNLSGIRGIVSVFMIWYQLSFLTRRCRVPSFASLRQASWNFTPN